MTIDLITVGQASCGVVIAAANDHRVVLFPEVARAAAPVDWRGGKRHRGARADRGSGIGAHADGGRHCWIDDHLGNAGSGRIAGRIPDDGPEERGCGQVAGRIRIGRGDNVRPDCIVGRVLPFYNCPGLAREREGGSGAAADRAGRRRCRPARRGGRHGQCCDCRGRAAAVIADQTPVVCHCSGGGRCHRQHIGGGAVVRATVVQVHIIGLPLVGEGSAAGGGHSKAGSAAGANIRGLWRLGNGRWRIQHHDQVGLGIGGCGCGVANNQRHGIGADRIGVGHSGVRCIGGGAIAKVPVPVGDSARRSIGKSDRERGHSVRWAGGEVGDQRIDAQTGDGVAGHPAVAGKQHGVGVSAGCRRRKTHDDVCHPGTGECERTAGHHDKRGGASGRPAQRAAPGIGHGPADLHRCTGRYRAKVPQDRADTQLTGCNCQRGRGGDRIATGITEHRAILVAIVPWPDGETVGGITGSADGCPGPAPIGAGLPLAGGCGTAARRRSETGEKSDTRRSIGWRSAHAGWGVDRHCQPGGIGGCRGGAAGVRDQLAIQRVAVGQTAIGVGIAAVADDPIILLPDVGRTASAVDRRGCECHGCAGANRGARIGGHTHRRGYGWIDRDLCDARSGGTTGRILDHDPEVARRCQIGCGVGIGGREEVRPGCIIGRSLPFHDRAGLARECDGRAGAAADRAGRRCRGPPLRDRCHGQRRDRGSAGPAGIADQAAIVRRRPGAGRSHRQNVGGDAAISAAIVQRHIVGLPLVGEGAGAGRGHGE